MVVMVMVVRRRRLVVEGAKLTERLVVEYQRTHAKAGCHVAAHLLHSAKLPLLLRIRELDYEAGRGARHGLTAVQRVDRGGRFWMRRELDERTTFTLPIWSTKNGALLDAPEALKKVPNVLLRLLLAQHAHEQLAVLSSALAIRRLHLDWTVHTWKYALFVERGLRLDGGVAVAECQKGATLMLSREFILEHGELVNPAESLEDRPEVDLVQVARDLTHEELDGVWLLDGGACRRMSMLIQDRRSEVIVIGTVPIDGHHEGVGGAGGGWGRVSVCHHQ